MLKILSCWNKVQQFTTCNGQKTSNRTSNVHRKPFDLPNNEYRGEGGDFITENANKHIKGHLGSGVPTLQHWIRASRNHEKLQVSRIAIKLNFQV